ncbi:hypothetical protein WJ06_30065 [Burkholderia cepacia]|nr:hypothetical protein WJ06_30065 [Burkholderia cepacia]KVU57815.1 hypothetical protein WK70_17355 [Burkholderia cepacia]
MQFVGNLDQGDQVCTGIDDIGEVSCIDEPGTIARQYIRMGLIDDVCVWMLRANFAQQIL